MLSNLTLIALIFIFLGAAAIIWIAGIHFTDMYLSAMSGLLTIIYAVGLIIHPQRN